MLVEPTADGRYHYKCDKCGHGVTFPLLTRWRHLCDEKRGGTGQRETFTPEGFDPAKVKPLRRAPTNSVTVGPGYIQEDLQKPKRKPAKKPQCVHLGKPTGESFPPKDGLGDLVERGLNGIGITKERWAAVKAEAVAALTGKDAKPGDCGGCKWRQKMLNWLGRKLGMGKQTGEIMQLMRIEEGAQLPIYSCAIHGQCLPHRGLKGVEGAPHCCHGCGERQLEVVD